MRIVIICLAALLLAGCVTPEGTVARSAMSGSSPRPKSIVVTDFVYSSDVVVIDRNFTARLERKIGSFPTYERKQRTLERVNDEIVATIVATLREAGLDAQPGSEEGLSLSDDAVVVNGRLRPGDMGKSKDQIGIGSGRSGVVADMTLSRFAGFGKKQIAAFAAEPAGARKGAPASGKAAASTNAAIAAALIAEKAAAEKLSPDVEAQARKLGRAAGERIVALAREQGWLTAAAEAAEAAPEEKPAEETVARVVKLPPPRPDMKPEKPAT